MRLQYMQINCVELETGPNRPVKLELCTKVQWQELETFSELRQSPGKVSALRQVLKNGFYAESWYKFIGTK